MKLITWIAVIFVAHLLLYYALGTPTWIPTSILATIVWAAVLFISGAFMKQRRKTRA